MIINTLCKERKPQKVIAQKAVCSEYIHEKIIKPKRQMTTDFCGLSRIWERFISSRVRNIKSCHTQVSWRKVLHHHSPESEAALLKLHYCFSLVIWDATSSAGAFCFTVFYHVQSEHSLYVNTGYLEHFMFPSSDKFYGNGNFFCPAGADTCPQRQNHYQMLRWPNYYCAWLARHLFVVWGRWEILNLRKETKTEKLKADSQTTW